MKPRTVQTVHPPRHLLPVRPKPAPLIRVIKPPIYSGNPDPYKSTRRPPLQPTAPARKPKPAITPPAHRKMHNRLTTVNGRTVKLPFKPGSFNAGLVALPGTDLLVCVFRPDELSFTACLLNSDLTIVDSSYFPLGITNCADPRLVWVDGKLLMVYSSIDEAGGVECVRGGVIAHTDIGLAATKGYRPFFRFDKPRTFRISPPSEQRQKNWMPFVIDGQVFLTASVQPHVVYQLNDLVEGGCRQVYETPWISPWFETQFLRGNTNPVQLADGNWLGTFHSVHRLRQMHYYDNGCYVFEGKPPFRVLRCANRTYLRAEDAVEPHFRKKGQITVCFPVGMVLQDNRLLISYGDNDSAVKILETTPGVMLATTLEVY